MRRHSVKKSLFILFCLLYTVIILSGCGQVHSKNTQAEENFDHFLTSCFKEYVTRDGVTLHFKLSDPSSFHITKPVSPSFANLSYESQKAYCDKSQKLLNKLYSYPKSHLTQNQKLTWNILEQMLRQSVAQKDYLLYSSMLGNNGLPSQIPVTLSEYSFRNTKDVTDYLSLVNQVPDLFEQLLSFEEKRREAGIISPDFVITDTIGQIDQFLSDRNNLLIESFDERIQSLDCFSEDQKNSYIANNRSLVQNKIFPAYRDLKKSLKAYVPSGEKKERLCQYEKGKDYYRLLLSSNVGTEMTPEECIEALKKMLLKTTREVSTLTKNNPDLYMQYLNADPFLKNPNQIMKNLKEYTEKDFPGISDIPFLLKSVPDALSGTSACAFYMIPPIDSKNENIIYINQTRIGENEMFSTLAHEGYPGHLYQTNYFLSTNPAPLRTVLRTEGYDEGWGTYAQLYSYRYLSFRNTDQKTQTLLRTLCRDNDLLSLSLSSLSDLYVNYKNYDREKLASFLNQYGIDAESSNQIYEYVIENPAVYLSYGIGYYELDTLKQNMKSQFSKEFSEKKFHQAVLHTGSCNFSILHDEVERFFQRE